MDDSFQPSRTTEPFKSNLQRAAAAQVRIIHEDQNLLVLNKHAGLVCHPTKTDSFSSLIGRVRLYLGDVEAHLINRLDRETSGVVVVAKHLAAAKAWRKVWEARHVLKSYRALVHGHVPEDHGVVNQPLGKDEASRVAIKDCVREDGAAATTTFKVLKRFSRDHKSFSLLQVVPESGRKHQIRIHLAFMGHPIIGDKLYGEREDDYLDFVVGILSDERRRALILNHHGLHAEFVECIVDGIAHHFSALPEMEFENFATSAE